MTMAQLVRGLVVVVGAVVLAACGGGGDDGGAGAGDTAGDTGQTVEVTIVGSAFEPAEVSVPAGGTVQWTNEDDLPHTVTFDDDSVESSDTLDGGATYSATFDEPGEYAYHCHIHPAMTGTVVVE